MRNSTVTNSAVNVSEMVNLPLETSLMNSAVFDSTFSGNVGEEVQLEMSGRLIDRCLLNDRVGCDLFDKLNIRTGKFHLLTLIFKFF